MKGSECMKFKNYELLKEQTVDGVKSEGYILEHKKSGAKVILLSNDDENKVFTIGFRTPPTNSKGIQHIIEHSVLCGSKKYPAKDPFVELVKGSLNTFLNAITYPDKTTYPVASYNDADFQNLMSIYMDAVFNTNIYDKKQIFMQEGWHYELENADDELKINGVVYNEMKGAYSSAEELIAKLAYNNLFPDTTYSKDSGGDPKEIPELTYEEFLDYHRKYYHPSNSYIYLYGDMDMEEKLKFLDEEYLSKYDRIDIDSTINLQKGFGKLKKVKGNFAVTKGDKDTKSVFEYDIVYDTALNKNLCLAMDVLSYVLFTAQGAPVKKAMIDAGIGSSVYAATQMGYQPVFSIVAEDVNEEDFDKFVEVLRKALSDTVKNGVDKNAVLGYINALEFRYKENDFGRYPKGLMYGIQIFDRWIYDDEDPFVVFDNEDSLTFLKNSVENGYFEEVIEKYLLSEEHCVAVVMSPKEGLVEEEDEELRQKLANHKATLSKEEIDNIVKTTKELKQYQEEPSTKEELATIPTLKRSDIRKEALPYCYEIKKIDDTEIVFSNIDTNGIAYLKVAFNTKYVPQDLIPYIFLLKNVLMNIDTKKHTYYDLRNEINLNTGALVIDHIIYQDYVDLEKYKESFEFNTKVLYDKIPYVLDAMEEIINTSNLDDEKRLSEIIKELKTRLQSGLVSNSTILALKRALSYTEQSYAYLDLTEGIGYYEFIVDLYKNFDTKKDEIIANLKTVAQAIFKKENIIISYTSDKEGYENLKDNFTNFTNKLSKIGDMTFVPRHFELSRKNEAFIIPSQVQSVACVGNFLRHGHKYTAALQVARVMLEYDYCWVNIRLKGGAYGCSCEILNNGQFMISSYRDPNILETYGYFDEIANYIEAFDGDEEELTKYVIGTISEMDIPLNPSARGKRDYIAYITHRTIEDVQNARDQILNVTKEDIVNLAPLLRDAIDEKNRCVFGSEQKIMDIKDTFLNIRNLTKEQ